MNRRIGLIALAIVLAVVGTFAVYSYAHNADKRAVAKTRSAQVLYTQKQVPVGTTWGDAVKGGYFIQQRVPIDSVPTNAVQDTNASIPLDQVATFTVASGQIVVRPMFGDKTATTGILPIPKGLIAISVNLPGNADVAGFVQNGSEVAIFDTFKVVFPPGTPAAAAAAGADVMVTKLLLPRVTVVAASQNAPSDLNGAKNTNGSSSGGSVLITMAVSQKDAERMILAQTTGQLYLGLLSSTSVTGPDPGQLNAVNLKPAPVTLYQSGQ